MSCNQCELHSFLNLHFSAGFELDLKRDEGEEEKQRACL